jgi:hypothetical protein
MLNIYVNNAGDFELDDQKSIRMISDDDELLQEIRLTFQENKGEFFLTPDDGFPRYDILGHKFDSEAAVDAVYEVLLRNARIASVEQVDASFDRTDRSISVGFAATKTDGGQITGVIEV